jgi:hypothetical protein
MAHDEPAMTENGSQEISSHVHDYSSFTRLLKWGAIICLVVGLVWMSIVKAYW